MQGYNVVKTTRRSTDRMSFEDYQNVKARKGKFNKSQRQARQEWN